MKNLSVGGGSVFFVAPNGRDHWAGTEPVSSLKHSLGPWCTIEGVFANIVKFNKMGLVRFPATVYLRGGVYKLSSTALLENSIPVTIKPYPGEKVVISGAAAFSKWEKARINGKNVWRFALPGNCEDVSGEMLYVNGKAKKCASFPEDGSMLHVIGPGGGLFASVNKFNLKEKGLFNPAWYDVKGIKVLMTHLWAEERMNVESYDASTLEVTCEKRTIFRVQESDTEVKFYNVREMLKKPGEYYFDRNEKAFYYLPEKGEKMESSEPYVPGIGCLMCVDGGVSKNFANVTFEGIEFAHGGSYQPTVDYDLDLRFVRGQQKKNNPDMVNFRRFIGGTPIASAPQGAVQTPGMIFLTNAKNCVFRNCRFTQSGWYGIQISENCENVTIEDCEFAGLGAGGIRISGDHDVPATYPHNNVVKNCHIHDCTLINYSACGIFMGSTYGNLIEHNHIHDLFYSGISCGWTWGYKDQTAYDNRIGHNLIHDLGKGVLSDMGGIYLLGIQPGTRVYGNHVYNVKNRYYGGWGIYTDEGSSYIVIENNLCHDCTCEGLVQHFGAEVVIRHNVIAFNGNAAAQTSYDSKTVLGYEMPGKSHTLNQSFYGNVFVTDGTPFYSHVSDQGMKEIYSENNVLFDVKAKKVGKKTVISKPINADSKECTLERWQNEFGHDLRSVFADPKFRSLEKRDFRFSDRSPFKKDPFFKEFDYANVGIEKKK